jgi:hypothetical protein
MSTQEAITFQITVTNESNVPGFAIVPVYLNKPFAPVALPNLQLVGMKKVFLNAQEKQTVAIVIDTNFLSYIDDAYLRQPLKGRLGFSSGHPDHPLIITKEI